MHAAPLPAIAQSIVDDLETFGFPRALARLADPKDGGALAPVTAGLLRARALVGVEKWRDAYDVLQHVRGLRELDSAARLEAQVGTAKVLRIGWWSLDSALDMALAAARQATRTDALPLAVDAHLEAAVLFGRKRCRDLANAQLDAAAALGVMPARVLATRGDLAISFDERPAARDAYAQVLALTSDQVREAAAAQRLGRLGLLRLCTVLGEFAAASDHLAALGDRPGGDLPARRLAWQLHASQGDWTACVRVLDEILAASPDGDNARSLMLEAASARWRSGDVEGARAAWTRIAATGGGDGAARTAAGILDNLASGSRRRTRLQAFPSVTQLRNHCGPASVELCMRYFGTSAEQVAVAREIKHPDGGTPVHRMRRYMDAAGFHTRRVEADLDRLRAILDGGIPVILEEDYSTSRHVAVAIGYDDQRQILEVQDPMTHQVRETRYAELPKLREFSNHGALVAVPAGRPDLLAMLDAAGATECAYISLTDLAWEAHEQGRGDEADRLASEAIAAHEAYELAWVLRFVRAQDRARAEATPEAAAAVQGVLDQILRLWPDDEWPQQFLGRVRDGQGRAADALAAFERARDRDPDDANNWCSIGDCKLALSDYRGAREAFEEALRRDPAHVRSNENLADLALDDGAVSLASLLNDCARELSPNNAFNWYVQGRILAKLDRVEEGIAAYARAVELRPDSSGFITDHARLLARAGRVDAALAEFAALRAARPKDTYVLTNYADLAFNYGRYDACLEVCAALAELDPTSSTPLAIGGAAKCKRGDLEAGLADLRAALSRRPTYAWAQREIGDALANAGRWDEAITACAASLGLASSAEALFRLGDVLARAGHGKDAVGLLRRATRAGALTDPQLDRIAEVLLAVSGAGPTHDLFTELTAEFPRAVGLARAHARFLLETIWAPGAAVSVLSHLSELAPGNAWVLAGEADDLMWASMADEARGEALFREAIAAGPELVAPRRFFARALVARGRFAEALEVLAPCPTDAETLGDRVHALLGLGREDDARAAIDAWCDGLPEGVREARRRPLSYRIAWATRRFDEALALATSLSADAGELDDDGKLSRWEKARFECLVALGRRDEALAFGRAQCGRPRDFGELAYAALGQRDRELARVLATECHGRAPDDAYGLTVLARVAELDGEVDRAVALWQRMKQVSAWHVHDENLGRIALGRGELDAAKGSIEAAVATGHTCPIALQLRAELRLRMGDRDGARTDAERAWGCLALEQRDVSEDLAGLLAGLQGRADEATAAFEAWGRGEQSAGDRERIAALGRALGLA